MTTRRRFVVEVILTIAIAGHIALFAAGGSLRRMGIALVIVDVVSGLFVIGAVRGMRKLGNESQR